MNDSSKIGLRDFVVAIITAITAITGSYFMFQGNVKKADADMVATLWEQVQVLQKSVFELQAENTSMRIQLSKEYNKSSILKSYLDGMPYPAWIKLANEGFDKIEFVNWHINKSYESFFGINRNFYLGKTDDKMWPLEVAQVFYENDMEVLRRFAPRCKQESFPDKIFDSTKMLTAYVCKWPLEIDGQKAVAGQVFLTDLIKTK